MGNVKVFTSFNGKQFYFQEEKEMKLATEFLAGASGFRRINIKIKVNTDKSTTYCLKNVPEIWCKTFFEAEVKLSPQNLLSLVQNALINDKSFMFHRAGNMLRYGICPNCGRRECYVYLDRPLRVSCARLNNCCWSARVKDLYPEIFTQEVADVVTG